MNREWMKTQLEDYLALVREVIDRQPRQTAAVFSPDVQRQPSADAQARRAQRAQVMASLRERDDMVKRILIALGKPDLANFQIDGSMSGPSYALSAVEQALGILRWQDECDANLSPTAPTMPVDQLHPRVWVPASTLWESKHYREAVLAAAKAINADVQDRASDRTKSETDLTNHLFKQNPASGQTILRLPGDQADKTIQSRTRAIRALAEACFAGIRNPAAHEHGDEWDEQVALEYLATLSVLARWLDECEVLQAP